MIAEIFVRILNHLASDPAGSAVAIVGSAALMACVFCPLIEQAPNAEDEDGDGIVLNRRHYKEIRL